MFRSSKVLNPGARFPVVILLGLFCACLVALPALAGSICGHVQDSNSGGPVVQAGIFLRATDGTYTGDHTATDILGDYCLNDVPAGTYTIEVKVDDYLVAYVNGVVVTDVVSTVPISANMPPILVDDPWPNPAYSVVNFRLQVQRRTPLEMEIFDARGRAVRAWTAGTIEPGPRDYQWNGRDRTGRPAPTGLYLLRVRAGSHTISRPFLLTR